MNQHRALDGRHAVITGGGSGIGAAIAVELSRQGASLTLMGRKLEPLTQTATALGNAQAVVADVTDADSVNAAFLTARERQGPINILVNNAGDAESARFDRTTLELWQRLLAVNLTGTFLCTQAFLDTEEWPRPGRIVNNASTAGLTGYAYVSAYCASKHGVVGLTRALAKELAPHEITVNAVCPGYTDTPMLERTIENIVSQTGRSPDAARAELEALNPQGRLIEPREVAELVARLCQDDAGGLTGQAIRIDGGELF